MRLIILVLAVSTYANLITHWFTPFQWLKSKIGRIGKVQILNCPKCMGFWLGLVTGAIFPTGYNPILSALLVAPLCALFSFIIFEVIVLFDDDLEEDPGYQYDA